MEFLTDRNYSFVSKALDADTFAVVDIKGEEGLGRCYRFEIQLVTDDAEIDMDGVLRDRATFTIHRKDGQDVDFNGILAGFEQQQSYGSSVFYRAILVPRLWRLSLSRHNQVFLDQSVKEIAEAVLKDGGLTSRDFEFKLRGDYPKLAYVCQYAESHLDFISRRLEREGIYYYFEQTDNGEKIIITDTAIAHQERPHGGDLVFSPPSGLIDDKHNEIVLALVCRHKPLPRTVRLKDYNYRKPSLEVTAGAVVDETGSGEVYYYGEHFPSPQEGERLAKIRAQELLCGKQTFVGDSTVPYLSPGYTFMLSEHYRSSFNQKYLVVEMTHEGSQAGYLSAGFQQGLSERQKKVFYRNQFTAIDAGIQFRPLRNAHQPRIMGTLNARIDASGSGKYAELDEHGRYKVILPFDLSGRKDGKASAWLRMAQPYAGSGHGMHFPLHKGAEVLLTFIEGNPDRPVIAAAVPNPEAPSPVTAADQTMAKITTSGGNKIHIQDQEGQQRILLHSPTADTWVRMGAPNDPEPAEPKPKEPEPKETESKDSESDEAEPVTSDNFEEHYKEAAEGHEGYSIDTSGWFLGKFGAGKLEFVGPLEQKINYGNVFEVVLGLEEKIFLGLLRTELVAAALDIAINVAAGRLEFITEKKEFHAEKTKLHMLKTELSAEMTQMAGQTTKMIGENTKVIGDATKMIGDNRRMIGVLFQSAGEETEAIGDHIVATGQRIITVGEETKAAGSHVVAMGESIKTAGSNLDMAGERLELAESDTRMSAEMTELTENTTSISALTTLL